jgi:hypothetical protein
MRHSLHHPALGDEVSATAYPGATLQAPVALVGRAVKYDLSAIMCYGLNDNPLCT